MWGGCHFGPKNSVTVTTNHHTTVHAGFMSGVGGETVEAKTASATKMREMEGRVGVGWEGVGGEGRGEEGGGGYPAKTGSFPCVHSHRSISSCLSDSLPSLGSLPRLGHRRIARVYGESDDDGRAMPTVLHSAATTERRCDKISTKFKVLNKRGRGLISTVWVCPKYDNLPRIFIPQISQPQISHRRKLHCSRSVVTEWASTCDSSNRASC